MPQNVAGYQFPNSFISYMGFSIYNGPPYINSREYIEGTLIDTLVSGHTYLVSFYVSAPNNCKYRTDDIGAYFSNDTIGDNISNLVLSNYVPQIENTQGNILSDTLNWLLVSGYFTAMGGEKFVTIGNFKDDANTTLDSVGGTIQLLGYYYIDDVSEIDCTLVSVEEINGTVNYSLSPNPTREKLTIKCNNKIKSVSVLNMLGENVLQKDFNKSVMQHTIDVGILPKGIYLTKLLTEKGFVVKKFVRQ